MLNLAQGYRLLLHENSVALLNPTVYLNNHHISMA